MALWQRNQDLGLISKENTQPGLAKNSESGPSREIDLLSPLGPIWLRPPSIITTNQTRTTNCCVERND